MELQTARFALARLAFYGYLGFSLFTVVGGFITAPVMTWFFFGDWRFWRHLNPAWRLYAHGLKMFYLTLKGENNGFLFSVPLTSPPVSSPLSSVVKLRSDWKEGSSCGDCSRCCSKIGCPVLNEENGLCLGYDSFYWRYFNCGRYPSMQSEIDYYGCPKWAMLPVLVPEGEEQQEPTTAAS